MNSITLLGRLAKDPELTYSGEGAAYTRFVVAVNRENNSGVDFIHCLSFGNLAVAIADYCEKGRQVLLQGRLEINNSKNKETGQIRSFTTVIANKVEFLAKPREEYNNGQRGKGSNQRAGEQQYDQQRFQPSTNGWQQPADKDLPF